MKFQSPDPANGPSQMRHWLAKHNALMKALDHQEAEIRRKRTQKMVDEMCESTPESRIAAAKARARATYAKIDDTNAKIDLAMAQGQASAAPVDLNAVRIDDLETLFRIRHCLADFLKERIKKIHAKIHWLNKNGEPGPFNEAVHDNDIPVDKALTIFAHLHGIDLSTGQDLDQRVDAVVECGLFYEIVRKKIKKGKRKGQEHQFQYGRRCQDGEHCNLCNYINISDGLKILVESYDESAFNLGGNWFGITMAPRNDPDKARAVGRTLAPADWDFENPDSIVYRESRQGRVFRYPSIFDTNEGGDWYVESAIRRFLGAGQRVFGKVIKNGWLDGIRAKVENSIEFLPFASHQHWHAVGSSNYEHDTQSMAEFIKMEADKILAQTCIGIYADVAIAAIPTSSDLLRWIRYTNKTTDLVGPINSVYNRHPSLRRSDRVFHELHHELRAYLGRTHRVHGMIRYVPNEFDERGAHTYMLYRRYVRGNHKFGKGSILSEPDRHREWRKRHADNEAEFKRRCKIKKFAHSLGFDVQKCPRRQPDAPGYGTYHVVEAQSKAVVAAGASKCYGLSLRQCNNFLKKKQKEIESQN